jgi:1-aminocyclopropane-1-carboxylate deaminase
MDILEDRQPTPLDEVDDERLRERDITLLIKRDDLIDPDIPGNKWRKLKYNILEARASHHDTLLTFGGAFSNHIAATAVVGARFGFQTIGVIRGERHDPLNPVLAEAVGHGMHLHYMDRDLYRRKTSCEVIDGLHNQFGRFYLLPEGGSNELAVKGCEEIVREIDQDFDTICCACGTGGTFAGIVSGLGNKEKALGFAVLSLGPPRGWRVLSGVES